jgi:hypothetical protein
MIPKIKVGFMSCTKFTTLFSFPFSMYNTAMLDWQNHDTDT